MFSYIGGWCFVFLSLSSFIKFQTTGPHQGICLLLITVVPR